MLCGESGRTGCRHSPRATGRALLPTYRLGSCPRSVGFRDSDSNDPLSDIIHVVGHTEADHAIEAHELITTCAVVHQVIDDALLGVPDPFSDPAVARRSDWLVEQAGILLDAIAARFSQGFEGDAEQLARVVRSGLFDAPHLVGNPAASGRIVRVVDGGCDAGDPATGEVLGESKRVARIAMGNRRGQAVNQQRITVRLAGDFKAASQKPSAVQGTLQPRVASDT